MVGGFRRADDATPVVLMGYYNPIYVYGVDRFLRDAKSAGVDGLMVVDLPPEEDEELCLPALKAGMNFIRLATPTTDDKRLPAVLANTSGFVYYVSITGITGAATPDPAKVAAAVGRIKRHTKLPVAVGFGVRTAEQAAVIAAGPRARLARRYPHAREAPPPAEVRRVIDRIVSLLGGQASDLSAAALDMDGVPEFDRRVYEVARGIAPGATLSYGEIAARLGERGLARDVGQALGRNPFPIIVPCHRVLAAGGKAGGFSANGGVTTKLRLLTIERARTSDAPTLFDGDRAFGFALKPKAQRRR